jgi:hypothetical protein
MKKHAHKWTIRSYSTKEITFVCKCQETLTRAATKEEARKIKQGFADMLRHSTAIHRVWHTFKRRYMDGGTFKLSGFALMESVEKWAERFPDDVHILGCDDSMYMGSDIVLIEHKTPSSWHGVTAVIIPQCGDPVAQVFLYPSHVGGVLRALQGIHKKSRVLLKRAQGIALAKRKKSPFG